jgi:hypothetical protein
MVQRYDFIEETRETYAGSVESKHGKYVKWSDYERLADKLNELENVDYDKDNLISVYEKQLAELREKLRFIPVTERLPEVNKPVLCKYKNQRVYIAHIIQPGWEWIDNDSMMRNPTHWREISELGDGE